MPVFWLECDIRMLHLGIWRLVLGPMAHEKVSYWSRESINTTDAMFHDLFVGLRISSHESSMIGWNTQNFPNWGRKQISKLLCKLHLFKDNTIHTLASWASRFDYQPIRAGRSPPSSPESGFFLQPEFWIPPPKSTSLVFCVIHFQVFNSQNTCHLIHCLNIWFRRRYEEPDVEFFHSSPHKSLSTFGVSTFSIDTSCWPAGLDRSR